MDLRHGTRFVTRLPRPIRWLLIPIGEYCTGCPFWDADLSADKQMWGYCHHERIHDGEDGAFLLWDGCKECSAKLWHLPWRYR